MMTSLMDLGRSGICLSWADDRGLVSQAVLGFASEYLHALVLTSWAFWVLILPATHLCVVDHVDSLPGSVWYQFRYAVLSLYVVESW